MRAHKDVAAEAFAKRLQKAANTRGLTSGRSRSGVDVTAMASAIDVSYEMGRRYAEGLATSKPEAMRALAQWLRVSPVWLAYGEGEMEAVSDIDLVLLESCIRAVTDAQELARVKLEPGRISHLIAALYREAREGRAPSSGSVAATLKAMTA